MNKIGYSRVSTLEQNPARQIEYFESLNIGENNMYLDKLSGKDTNRPELQRMLKEIKEGDVLYVESVSRIARSTRDFLHIVDQLQKKGVEIISQKENIDTNSPQGRFMLTVFAALGELERESLLQKQKEGISIAKKEGKYKGREPIPYPNKFKETYKYWKDGLITAAKAMELLELKRTTFYKLVKEFQSTKV